MPDHALPTHESLRDARPGGSAKQGRRARLALLVVILMLATTHSAPGSWNDQSRIATVQSLVESGSFIIDNSIFKSTGDKVFINGHFYSDKPPVPAVLGAAVYLPLYHLGLALQHDSSVPYYLVTLLTVKLFWLLGSIAFFHALRFTGLEARKCFLASIALALGSLYFSWSTTFNSHELAASFLSIGFYFILRARFSTNVNLNLSGAAFFLALASTADMPTGVFYALFLLYVWRDARLRSGVVFYLLPLLVTVLPAFAMTYSIHHSIVPVQIVKSYFDYPGSPWIGSTQLSGTHGNNALFVLRYAPLLFIGPRGFLLYNPIAWVALWGLVRAIRQRGPFFNEAVVIATGSGILALYYVLFTSGYSGWSYSIRWFVPLLPLLFFFLYPYFEAYGHKRAARFRVLLAVAVVIAFVGALNPWSDGSLSRAPFIANIEELSTNLHGLGHFAFSH
jgi:hypothetical protein